MEDFCGSKFWDLNETWYTEDPDFTPCFEQTVLVWIPSAFLWTAGTLEIISGCWKRTRRRSISFLHAFQQCLVLVIAILQALELLNSFRPINEDYRNRIYPVENVAPGIKSVTFVWAFILQHLNRNKGIRNSGIVFFFWLLTAVCGAFEFRSALLHLPAQPSLERNDVRTIIILISYPFVILEFILHFFPDSKRLSQSQYEALSEETEASQVPCPEKLASFPSTVLFQWVWPIIKLGYKKPLESQDLWNLDPENRSRHLTKQFNRIWKPALKRCHEWNARHKQRSAVQVSRNSNGIGDEVQLLPTEGKVKTKTVNFLWALTKANFRYFMAGTIMKLVYDLLLFASPQLLNLLIQHVNSNEEKWKGYLYACALFAFNMTGTISIGLYFQRMMLTAMRVRSAIVGAIYEKALVISNAARKESTTGEIVNLMSVDAQRIVDILPYVNGIWSSPLQISLALYFLYQVLGVSVFAGVGTMVLLIPLNIFVAKQVEKLEVKQMKFKDQRVKAINEILSGIKVLKLYAWEPSFENQVNEIRAKELQILKWSAYIDAFNEFVWYTAPFLVSLATFGTYVFIDENNVLDAQKAFVALSLFNIMRMPLSMIPYILVFAVQAGVSVKRINKFLNAEEVSPADISHTEQNDGAAVSIENCDFAWDEKQEATLENINVNVSKGSLVAVVGAVGSGKSSLLAAMLGEIRKLRGSVNTVGSIAYVAQQAWIQNASLRDNILFGREYTADTYDSVIDSCALHPDLEILPAGDKTEIGEKGINLSGGQKQRVSLARAVYSDADVYLLDDPLSAVDSHVGKQLFEKVIGPNGMLREKTRVMVTHSVTYLPSVDHIIVMSKGGIREAGTFQELIQKGGAFSEFLAQYGVAEDLEAIGVSASVKVVSGASKGESSETELVKTKDDGNEPEKKGVDQLIEDETAETGSVRRNVYLHYLKSIGWDIGVLTVAFHILAHGLTAYSNIWLSKWSSEPASLNRTEDIAKRDLYLGVYGGLGLGQAMSIFVATLSMSLGSIRAARFLHSKMLTHILRSPMSFFDTTPLGRIVNRFSKDIDSIDYAFPATLRTFMNCVFEVVATLVVISYSTPLFLVAIIPIGIVYLFVQRFYVVTSRQLKRLDSVSKSPIYSHFSETLSGTATIRAFACQQRFAVKSQKTVDDNQRAYYASIMSNRWLAVRLEGMGNVIGFLSALFAVVAHPSAGIVGLSVSYALNVTDVLNWLVRMSSEVETDVVAVERIKEYGETPQEASWEIPENKPPLNWPSQGAIRFANYQTRYRDGMDLVLRDVTFSIRPGDKVGIVGRTGAGKSSMTLGLFRIIEAAGGSIEIDGINVSTLGLHDLRSRLTIIPQDPVLFSGSLRLNLDPFEKYTDDEVWSALEYAHLKEYVGTLASGIEHEVSEGGENLSVGQRQLVCLARALLRKTKILILDEATAAVDLETDDLIQRTIREKFKECTVLTIAHRLNTIMDYDRILVLDKGEIREFDSPGNLLRDQSSLFYSMAKDTGLA